MITITYHMIYSTWIQRSKGSYWAWNRYLLHVAQPPRSPLKGRFCIACHNVVIPNIPECFPAPKGETTKMVIHRQEVECSLLPSYYRWLFQWLFISLRESSVSLDSVIMNQIYGDQGHFTSIIVRTCGQILIKMSTWVWGCCNVFDVFHQFFCLKKCLRKHTLL